MLMNVDDVVLFPISAKEKTGLEELKNALMEQSVSKGGHNEPELTGQRN